MKKFFKNKTPAKADSKIMLRGPNEQSYGSVEEQMMIKSIQDESWKLQVVSQGFDSNTADIYANLSTGSANYDAFNLHERAYINEDPSQKLSLTNVCKVVNCQYNNFSEADLSLIETAFGSCTPGWISAFFGKNTYRDPSNVAKYGEYKGRQLFVNLFYRLLNCEFPHINVEQVRNITDRLSTALLKSFEKGINRGFAWHSQSFNDDVIESILENSAFLRLLSGILKEPSTIVSWKTRENICKVIVIVLSHQQEQMSGLEIMFKRIGDSDISIFINQAFDMIQSWVPLYLEARRKEYLDTPRGFKRKHDDEMDVDEHDEEMQPPTKKSKNFAFGHTGLPKKRQFNNLNPVKAVASKVSKFSKTIKGSIRQVRKIETTEPDFNDRVIDTTMQEDIKNDPLFANKFNDFFVNPKINIVLLFAFYQFIL